MIKTTLTATLCLLLASCASLNEDECLMADWYQIGFTDGASGVAESYIGKHRKACSKHGVQIRLQQWLAGRDDGLRRYCTEENGLQQGLTGKHYLGVCSGESAFYFEQAYQIGKQVYQQRQQVDRLEKLIDTGIKKIDKLDEEWHQVYEQSKARNITTERRRFLLDQLKDIKDEQDDIRFGLERDREQLYREAHILRRMEADLLH